MLRLLATTAAAALVLTPIVVGLAGTASAGPTATEVAAPVRTASVEQTAVEQTALREAPAGATAKSACARTVRVVGGGYGEPVLSPCRTPAAVPLPPVRP
jgi:hypothetical protein